MKKSRSAFYPPRASGRLRLYYAWCRWRMFWQRQSLKLPGQMTIGRFLASLVFPGFAFSALNHRVLGCLFIAGYFFSGLVFLAFIGYPLATAAVCSMICIHVASLLLLLKNWDYKVEFLNRLLAAGATIAVLALGVYLPLRRQIEQHYLMPLKLGDEIVVVKVYKSPKTVRRGDLVAFKVGKAAKKLSAENSAFRLNRVAGFSGDRVRVTPEHYEVSGQLFPRQPNAAPGQELVVPEKHWFLSPELVITGAQNIPLPPKTDAGAGFLVEESDFIGVPVKRWFWR